MCVDIAVAVNAGKKVHDYHRKRWDAVKGDPRFPTLKHEFEILLQDIDGVQFPGLKLSEVYSRG